MYIMVHSFSFQIATYYERKETSLGSHNMSFKDTQLKKLFMHIHLRHKSTNLTPPVLVMVICVTKITLN